VFDGAETGGWNLTALVPFKVVTLTPKESLMADNKDPSEKQPGENPEGTYHFNPGNMAGKKPKTAENRDEPNKHKGKGGG
jgi:hypothetical protein